MKPNFYSLIVFCLAIIFFSQNIKAQTNTFPSTGSAGIGTVTPLASALLDMESTAKGLLVPRMTTAQRNGIKSPATGLLIYQTNGLQGFFYYTGSAWKAMKSASYTAGTGININGSVITNTAPDQIVTLASGSGISVSGTYPNFTVSSTLPSQWTTSGNNIVYSAGDAIIHNVTVGTGSGSVVTNTAMGNSALNSNTTGNQNTANGNFSLNSNTTGNNNNADGYTALYSNTTGVDNAAAGSESLYSNTTGSSNTANGYSALFSNTTGYSNVAIGIKALFKNQTASNQVAAGDSALLNNTTGTENTAVGSKALYSNTTGFANTATGYQALYFNSTFGFGNTANGYLSLYANTNGEQNTANGYQSLYANTTGNQNTASGQAALSSNTGGSQNTAVGALSLVSNTTGSNNLADGVYALNANTTGSYNVANGYFALESNTTGNTNTGDGNNALSNNTTGYSNVAVGVAALFNNQASSNLVAVGDSALLNNTAIGNTAIGSKALYTNTAGYDNTANGFQTLYSNTTGYENTATGNQSLYSNVTGDYNTANGLNALYFNTAGIDNTAIGEGALSSNTIGSNNTAAGYGANVNAGAFADAGAFGSNALATASDQVRIGDGSVTSIGGYANWTNISDGRVKKNIQQNVPGLAFIKQLTPVTYNLDLAAADAITQPPVIKDSKGNTIQPSPQQLTARTAKEQIIYTGFIAQDVEKAAQAINYNFSGVDPAKNSKDLYGLRYSDFVVPLVKAVQELSTQNDSLKNTVQPLQATVTALQQQMNDLKNTIVQMQSAMSQCCSSFSSNMQSANNLQSVINNNDQPILNQNVPNPFNGSSYITYYVPQGTHNAQLMITDISGHTLQTYILATSGYGKQTINAAQLSNGMYQYSLLIDGKLIDTKKMVLAK